MLHLTELLRLFAQKQSSENSAPAPVPKILSNISKSKSGSMRQNVNVVGYEGDMTFLVARDDLFLNRTCIELVEHTKNGTERKVLYVHDCVMKCMSASLNQTRSILGKIFFFD
jgi:hypothetical protein